jgi:hypothetical protein
VVDPIALRQKLLKHQIGPKFPHSLANAVQAVQEREEQVRGRGWDTKETDPSVPLGILSREELAYCVNSFAQQWEVPA